MGRILLLLLLVGCRQFLGFDDPISADAVSSTDCRSSLDCNSSGLTVCDLETATCVQCTAGQPQPCSGDTPVCGSDQSCRGCESHDECPSLACLRSGVCASEDEVAYVTAGAIAGSDNTCRFDDPCGSLDEALATGKPTIKVTGTIDARSSVTIDRDVVILADLGARLRPTTMTGPAIQITLDARVEIDDLEIREASGAGGHGISIVSEGVTLILDRVRLIQNGGRGIDAPIAQRVTMRRCIVSSNFGGGVNVQGAVFDITNSLIVGNGSAGANSGGALLDPRAGSTFEFNTIADNVSLNDQDAGVACINPFAASNNIVTTNGLSAGCAFTFSLFDNSTTSLPLGTGNLLGSPSFASTDPSEQRGSGFYRITNNSAAVDNADPTATLDEDIDGQGRPNGTVRDIGADELDP